MCVTSVHVPACVRECAGLYILCICVSLRVCVCSGWYVYIFCVWTSSMRKSFRFKLNFVWQFQFEWQLLVECSSEHRRRMSRISFVQIFGTSSNRHRILNKYWFDRNSVYMLNCTQSTHAHQVLVLYCSTTFGTYAYVKDSAAEFCILFSTV